MTLTGNRLGVYEITVQIGEGGMGQVYRARDTKLNREVALKVLPDSVANDSDRLARFTREAQTLAALNHPNIAHIHGLEESGGVRALVMELVEGEDLSQRLARGPLPLDDALPIARQIAEALEAAHDQGIVHRDLKPANIKVRPDGTVKVLDFGLAKALAPEGPGATANVMASPTITSPAHIRQGYGGQATEVGMILGTAAYMAPEQARGKVVDRRADIWAFGCVLYEMLTAKRAFDGDNIVDVLGAVARLEPDFDALRPDVPARVRRVLQLCLRKDVRQRAQAIGDVRLAIEGAFETEAPSGAAAKAAAPRVRLAWAAGGVAAVAAIALAIPAVRHWRESAPTPLSGRFNAPLPGTSPGGFALSPSGRLLAFTSVYGGVRRLWVRPLNSLDARPLPGTDGAQFPFWSPDEEHLAFFGERKLKRIAVAGGPPQTLCDAPTPRGGTWNRNGVIVFAPNISGGLFRVPADGGAPLPVTQPAGSLDTHRFPAFIAGGNRFLFVMHAGSEASGLYAGSLEGGAPVHVLADMSRAEYVPLTTGARTGVLLFTRESSLMALPFDPETLRAKGAAVAVVQDVGREEISEAGSFAASETGVLVFGGSGVRSLTLTWIDRMGRQTPTKTDPQIFESLGLAPDGTQAAVGVRASQTASDLWLEDLERGVTTRFTFGPGRRRWAVWSPDGRDIVFVAVGGPPVGDDIVRKRASGAGAEEILAQGGSNAAPLDISPDGRLLVYSITGASTKDDLWLLPLQGAHTPAKYLDGPSEERHAQFSPDGRWIAYSSDESGQFQVFVQAVPATGAKRQISTQGGSRPRWRRDGKELYYLGADGRLMAVPMKLGAGTLEVGAPERLFDLGIAGIPGMTRPTLYVPARDGQKFLALLPPEGSSSAPPVTIWMNWMAGIGK